LAAEKQYAESQGRIKQAESQLSGEAPLPTLTPERNFAEAAYQSAGTSIGDVPRFAGYIGGWLAQEAGSETPPTDNAVYGLGQSIDDWSKKAFPADPARADEFGTKAANLAGFLATLYGAGGIRAMSEGGPALAEKLGRVASYGSQASLAASSGAMGQFEGATQAMEQGGDVTERDRAISTLLGAGVGLTGLIPLASSLATPAEREAGAVMAEMLKGSGVTASQMAGYNVMSNAIAKAFYDPERALTEGIGDDVSLGALAGAVTHGAGALAKSKPRVSSLEEIQDFISRARATSRDPGAAEYFNGMRDWTNSNIPRLPPPGGEGASGTSSPTPPVPSGGQGGRQEPTSGATNVDLRANEGQMREWVEDVYGEGYRGEITENGSKLDIVSPDGRKLVTYDRGDLEAAGALPEPKNIAELGPYAIRRAPEGETDGLGGGAPEGEQQGEASHDAQSAGAQGPGGLPRQTGGERTSASRIVGTERFDYADKHGTPVVGTVNRERTVPGIIDRLVFRAYPENTNITKHQAPEKALGMPMARVTMNQHPNGEWEIGMMETMEGNEKRGLTKNMLDKIEGYLGKLRGSGLFWEPGYDLWKKRSPDAVTNHRLVQGEWLSPPYIARMIDANNKIIAGMDEVRDWEDITHFQRENRELQAALDSVPEEARTPEALSAPFALRGFYRPDVQALDNIKQEKATGQQWGAMLSKAPGAKRWLDLIGFDEWAASQKGAIRKQDVLDFMRAHDVEMEEHVLGDLSNEDRVNLRDEVSQDLFGGNYNDLGSSERDFVDSEINSFSSLSDNAAKFRGHSISGGENYKEILLRLPMLRDVGWRSPHFKDYEVVHMRVDDRAIPDGRRILFLNELQSDLHQRGREHGYRPADYKAEVNRLANKQYEEELADYRINKLAWDQRVEQMKEADKRYNEVSHTIDSWVGNNTVIKSKIMNLGSLARDVKGNISDLIVTRDEDHSPEWLEIRSELLSKVPEEYIKSLRESYNEYWESNYGKAPSEPDMNDIRWEIENKFRDKSPDAPFKADWWWEIGLKNLIRKAVEGGYDGVSIARSDQIEDEVGAEKGSLSVFYDQKMPRFLEKYIKKLGGKVGRELVVNQDGGSPYTGVHSALLMIGERPGDFGLAPERGDEAARTAKLLHTDMPPKQIIEEMSPELRKAFNGLFFDKRANLAIQITPEMRETILGKGQPIAKAPERPFEKMESALEAGQPVLIQDDVVRQVHQDVSLAREMTPANVGFHALSKIEPREDGRVNVTFSGASGEPFTVTADSFRDLQDLRGLCLEDGSNVLIFDFGPSGGPEEPAPGGASEVRANARAGVALHEGVHALYRQGRLPADDWARFVGHANSLGVMEMPFDDLLVAIGEQPQGYGISLREAYALQYQHLDPRTRDKLLNEEEPVAHMVELFHHKHYPGDEMQPIADILAKMLGGEYANAPEDGGN